MSLTRACAFGDMYIYFSLFREKSRFGGKEIQVYTRIRLERIFRDFQENNAENRYFTRDLFCRQLFFQQFLFETFFPKINGF